MPWITIATRDCGCEIMQLDEPGDRQHGESFLRSIGPCKFHLCRLCGDTPLADAEPDELCLGCYLEQPLTSDQSSSPSTREEGDKTEDRP